MLVGALLDKTSGPKDQAQLKVQDWLNWNFPWLNTLHRDHFTGIINEPHPTNAAISAYIPAMGGRPVQRHVVNPNQIRVPSA